VPFPSGAADPARPRDFQTTATDGAARAGILTTPHGIVRTPAFLPVGTVASVKGLGPDELRAAGVEMVLGNTYHLHHRPGEELVASMGGLAAFMGWNGPTLTDSGGFQVFSLSETRKIDEAGVAFRSVYDGRLVHLTPERAGDIQRALGADLIYALDECPPYPASRDEVDRATALTTRWAERFLSHLRQTSDKRSQQGLTVVIQGGLFDDLRVRSLEELALLDPDTFAIGGVSVGEPPQEMYRVAEICCSRLPSDRVRHLLGVGTPEDLLTCIGFGVDLFDCVLPTRNGRNGETFTSSGRIDLRLARFRSDQGPLDPICGCPACRNFSRAYLHHLTTAGELLGMRLLSLHNIAYYEHLMQQAQAAIVKGEFGQWKKTLVAGWKG